MKVNITLQRVLDYVVSSFNELSRNGVVEGEVHLSFRFMQLKGDWKFVKQSLNLVRYATSDAVCWCCMASKGVVSPSCNFTDLRPCAVWRSTVWNASSPWVFQPSLCNLLYWDLRKVMPDLLHVYHLGVGRDLLLVWMAVFKVSNMKYIYIYI